MSSSEKIVKCTFDDRFIGLYGEERGYSCGENFLLEPNNIYKILGVDYFGDDLTQYYSICPKCGCMTLLDDDVITAEEKLVADKNLEENPYMLLMNRLKSEFIYLQMSGKKVRKLVR